MPGIPGTLNRHGYPALPPAEYERRHALVTEAMAEWGVECLILYGGYKEMYQQNAAWLSGCREAFQFYVVFTKKGEGTVLSALGPHLLNTKRMSVFPDVRPAGFAPAGAVAERVRELGLADAPIGIVGVHSGRSADLPHEQFEALRAALPGAELRFLTREYEDLSLTKSSTELVFYRYGARATDEAMRALVRAVRPGASEAELYGELVAGGYRAGGVTEFALLGSTPMRAPEMPYPWHVPSLRRVGPGDLILNEVSVAYAGCSGQLILPIALGEPPAEYRELHALALEVMRRIAKVLKPGSTEQEILEAARPIEEAGLASRPLPPGWPHPPLRPLINLPPSGEPGSFALRENQLIMIEPNPTHPDGERGIFLGALHVVTGEGGKNLQGHPLDFVVK